MARNIPKFISSEAFSDFQTLNVRLNGLFVRAASTFSGKVLDLGLKNTEKYCHPLLSIVSLIEVEKELGPKNAIQAN